MSFLGVSKGMLTARNGMNTAREITQQPATIRATARLLEQEQGSIEAFLAPILAQKDLRIILTGAGTSAFIGECLARWLSLQLDRRVEAIATTDITSAPHLYLELGRPTLMVSFARSGDSPESVAAVDSAERLLSGCHHLAITCNRQGKLARRMDSVASGRTILLPEETHDLGFAMTSSFTAMTFAALAVLGGIQQTVAVADRIAASVEHVVTTHSATLASYANEGFERVVFLGSHVLKGAACEAALKLLELTDGQVLAMHDTPLGFRHGPKTVANDRTLVILFLSNDSHSRAYDLDLARELASDGRAGALLVVDARAAGDIGRARFLQLQGLDNATDVELVFADVVIAQVFAFHSSLAHGITPDNPDQLGTVNRVVQGVRIHAVA